MPAALPNRIPSSSVYRPTDPRERLIVALDVSTTAAAQKIVHAVGDSALTSIKVGMQLYTASGAADRARSGGFGRRVFLDLKYHDIPNTVGSAVTEAAKAWG